ncbi:MAG: kdpD [bacterium]|nr:kdpD [bacterium]
MIALAKTLALFVVTACAEIVRLGAPDPAASLLDFAPSHGVGHIVIGRSHQPWWQQIFGRSVPLRLVREAAGFDVHIVSFLDEERPS